MSKKTGIVIVSHSKDIAQGIVELISQVATDVPITFSAGTEDGRIGTSFQQIKETVDNNAADTILGFFDFGSSKMNLEMVGELSEKNILMCKVPLVEGAYTAASLLQAGVPFEAVIEQLREMDIDK
ncbi:phosphotransferase mannnose-specific family component IIA [Streptococcus infantarius subsp. infantarius]|nr:phosphotransferase mannnose-specific family component IIA [Streptococcus infantarius subsp. infantarius]